MRLVRIALFSALLLAGCGTGSMIMWNPRTGLCDEVPKAAAYALGGVLFATMQDVDKWRCEGLKDGDTVRTEKPNGAGHREHPARPVPLAQGACRVQRARRADPAQPPDDLTHPLPCYRVGGKILVRRSEFDGWIARHRQVGSGDVDRLVADALKGL